MNISEKIKEICTANFSGFSYVFEDWYDADAALDRVTLPAIIAVLPVSGSLEIRNGRAYDQENMAVAFVDKVPHGANGDDNGEVFHNMKAQAEKFIRKVNASGYFEPLEGAISYSVIYEQLSAIVTGVYMDLQLKEREGRC